MKLSRIKFALLLIVLTVFSGCSGSKADPRGERFTVGGEVLLGGKPLSRARIIFVPVDRKKAVKATGTINEGFYKIESKNGPLAGKMRVEIQTEILELEEVEKIRGDDKTVVPQLNKVDIPEQYNVKSELTAEVRPDEKNTFDFSLVTKNAKK